MRRAKELSHGRNRFLGRITGNLGKMSKSVTINLSSDCLERVMFC